jgi:hypothetical protein
MLILAGVGILIVCVLTRFLFCHETLTWEEKKWMPKK